MKIETISATAVAYGGCGVGRAADGRVCFVPNMLAGERAEVRITAEKKNFMRGEVLHLLNASEDRISPCCPLACECQGCAYMHCSYESEIRWKQQQLCDFLLRRKLAENILPPLPSPKIYGYRNKLVLHRGADGCYGYFAKDNVSVMPLEKCLLADDRINRIIPEAFGKRVLFRAADAENAVIIDPKKPVVLCENIPGFGRFRVAGDGFFQTNIDVAAALLGEVVRTVETIGTAEMLELYCGTGVFSVACAEKCPSLSCVGVEIDKKAIGFAKSNAADHSVADRCRFIAQDAGKFPPFCGSQGRLLLIDPPRGGVEKSTLQKIIRFAPDHMIYISCAADTLARDLEILVNGGYRVSSVRLLDMFPRTAHFEVFSVLEKIS